MSSLLEQIVAFRAHCGTVAVEHGPILVSQFLTGLIGSVTHCVGMCGPIVASQSLQRASTRLPGAESQSHETWQRLRGAALLPYQFGRGTTYMVLGALVAAPVGLGALWSWFNWLPQVLLTFAAMMFLIAGTNQLGIWAPLAWNRLATAGGIGATATGRWRPWRSAMGLAGTLMRDPTGPRGYLLGILLGFLPCGLLYGALIVAASTGNSLAAAMAMLAFTLGTFPISWAIAYGSRLGASNWRGKIRIPLALLTIFNGLLLLGVLLFR